MLKKVFGSLIVLCCFPLLCSLEAAHRCSFTVRVAAEAAARILVGTSFDSGPILYITKSIAGEPKRRSLYANVRQFQIYLGVGRSNPGRIEPLKDSKVLVTALDSTNEEGERVEAILRVESLDRLPQVPQPNVLEKDILHAVGYAVWNFAKLNVKDDFSVPFPNVVRESGSARGVGTFTAIIPTPDAMVESTDSRTVRVRVVVHPRSRQAIRSIEVVE